MYSSARKEADLQCIVIYYKKCATFFFDGGTVPKLQKKTV